MTTLIDPRPWLLGLLVSCGAFAGPVEEQTYKLCAGCHGFAGQGSAAVAAPAIGGQEAWYLARQLTHYREGIRGGEGDPAGQLMASMVKGLGNEDEIADLAAFIADLPPATPTVTLNGNAEAGRVAYQTCAACHGPTGEGNRALNAPALRGLDDWYLVAQLRAYRDGHRGSHPKDGFGQQMAPLAAGLSDDQMRDIAAHVATMER